MARNAIQLAYGPRWFPWTTLHWSSRSTCATIVWSDAEMTQPPHQVIGGRRWVGDARENSEINSASRYRVWRISVTD